MQIFLSNKCLLLFVSGNWWNILIVLETTEDQKVPELERPSSAVLKRAVRAFPITFLKSEVKPKKSW